MGPGEIAVICVVGAAFIAAVAAIIIRKIKHKGGCGCDCGCCDRSCGKKK